MRQVNILFLGGAKRISLAERFIGASLKLDISINFFSYELNNFVPISKYAKIIIGKKFNDGDCLSDLERIISTHNIDIVIPCVDPAVGIASSLRENLKSIFIPVSPKPVADLFLDKVSCDSWFSKNDFPVPSFDGNYPAIAKPRYGSASKGLKILKNHDEMINFMSKNNLSNYLIQKFIVADEYTVDAYVSKSGEIVGVLPRIRLETVGGEATISETVADSDIIHYSRNLLKLENFTGPITIQFLREKETKNLFILEVNPRLGGGAILSIEAGFDLPLLVLSEYLNVKIKKLSNYKVGLIMTRAFQEVFCAANH